MEWAQAAGWVGMTPPPGPLQAPGAAVPTPDQALRHAAHDLRMALAGLTDHLKLIAPESLDPDAAQHIQAALHQADTLGRLVARSLADLTGDPSPREQLDIEALQRQVEAVFAPPAARSGARLTIQCAPVLPRRMDLDRLAVERILANLIGNAIRHAGARGIELRLHPADGHCLGLRVCDDGPGFPTGVLNGAHGMGLGAVAGLVADLGGRWGLANRLGGGAEVWVDLPCRALSDPAKDAAAPAPTLGRLAGARVLVADDSEATRHLIAALLRAEGAVVDLAATGPQAAAVLKVRAPDLVMLDATIPGLSGAQLIRLLRELHGGAVPALAMTADMSVQQTDELILAGATRVVVKPLPDPAEVLRIAERLLRQAAPAPAPLAAPTLPPEATPTFDPEPLGRVFGLAGPEMAREILDRLTLDLTETAARLERAGQPPDAVELRAATHVMIALAGTAGAMLLLNRTQALNRRIHAGQLADLGPALAELRHLTQGAIAAIARLPLPPAPQSGTGGLRS